MRRRGGGGEVRRRGGEEVRRRGGGEVRRGGGGEVEEIGGGDRGQKKGERIKRRGGGEWAGERVHLISKTHLKIFSIKNCSSSEVMRISLHSGERRTQVYLVPSTVAVCTHSTTYVPAHVSDMEDRGHILPHTYLHMLVTWRTEDTFYHIRTCTC